MFGSYLAHKGLLGRNSARLGSCLPRTRTSLGPSPRCFRSAMLLHVDKRRFACVCAEKDMRLYFFSLLHLRHLCARCIFLLQFDPWGSLTTCCFSNLYSVALMLFLRLGLNVLHSPDELCGFFCFFFLYHCSPSVFKQIACS